jgi:murein DD-endopeptidase MepM/ murein hydrolase activator NlpD
MGRRLAHVFDSGVVATVDRGVRTARRVAIGVGVLAAVGAASYGVRVDHAPDRSSLAAIGVEPTETPVVLAVVTEREVVPPLPDLSAEFPIPSKHGTPLDELYPSLDGWTHPVVGTDLVLSKMPTGMFGAERNGVMRRECRDGHCGIDLSGPIGRPVVAVAPGIVVHIDRSENGRDGRSGRYVRIEHADGAMTAYMHLNSIKKGIDVGTRVDAGDQVGALGNSGIQLASPHLHFSLEIPNVPGTHGDHVNTHYVDPAPFLARATVTESASRRQRQTPSF